MLIFTSFLVCFFAICFSSYLTLYVLKQDSGTPDMRKFVYKRRADGLAVLNTNLIDDKLREAVKFLVEFDAKDIL